VKKLPAPPINWQVAVLILMTALAFSSYVKERMAVSKIVRTSSYGVEDLLVKAVTKGNPNTIQIITRSKDENGVKIRDYFEYREIIPDGSAGTLPPHAHLDQEETVTVESGTLAYMIDGEMQNATAGSTFTVPAGKAHVWWPETDTATVRVRVEPAHFFGETMYETLAGFTRDHGSAKETPMLQICLWSAACNLELSFLPWHIKLLARQVFPHVGLAMGYQPSYPEYCTICPPKGAKAAPAPAPAAEAAPAEEQIAGGGADTASS